MRGVKVHTLVGAVVATLVALLSVAAYAWLFTEVRSLVAEVAIAAEEASILSTQNKNTQTIRRVVRDTKEERAELQSYFVNEDELVSFLEKLEAVGVRTGAPLSVENVGARGAVDKDGLIVPLSLSLRATGTFRQVVHTLALVEAFPKVLSLERVRLSQLPDEGWQAIYEVELLQGTAPREE